MKTHNIEIDKLIQKISELNLLNTKKESELQEIFEKRNKAKRIQK